MYIILVPELNQNNEIPNLISFYINLAFCEKTLDFTLCNE